MIFRGIPPLSIAGTLPWRHACIVPTGICAPYARQKMQSTLESITYFGFAANKPLAFEEGPASP
jgi:hypothetical protein